MKEKKMNSRTKLLSILLVCTLFSFACVYVVLPEGLEASDLTGGGSGVWSAVVTNVSQSEAGDLRIELTVRNDTGDWSTMHAVEGKPAVLTGGGKTTNCETVFVSTGGHRLAPGFQMRGYTVRQESTVEVQPLYVECAGAGAAAGAALTIDYVNFNGVLDDYDPEANQQEGVFQLNLDEVVADLTYPVAAPVDGLVREVGTEIAALSDNVVTLLDVQRIGAGFQFNWQNFNPTKFPLRTHIGTPPVICTDGVIYGIYERLDIAPIEITPPSENMEWTTEVGVPQDAKGCYILLSVESRKPRTYLSYAIDIADK
jgi:hypothetical protein